MNSTFVAESSYLEQVAAAAKKHCSFSLAPVCRGERSVLFIKYRLKEKAPYRLYEKQNK